MFLDELQAVGHSLMMLGGSGSEPQFAVRQKFTRANNGYSTGHCVAGVFWTSLFVFLHPVVSAKHLSVSLFSFETKRKAITLEVTLKINFPPVG